MITDFVGRRDVYVAVATPHPIARRDVVLSVFRRDFDVATWFDRLS